MLKTKLHLPPPPNHHVLRPRLLDRLHTTLRAGHRLTVVAAPAGYGKTALLSAWLHAERERSDDVRVAWLALDEVDNDVVKFWRGAITSLQQATRRQGLGAEALGLLQTPGPPAFNSILTALINELADGASPVVLALDDYHLIQSAAVHGSLSQFIDRLPPAVHVTLATRAEPPVGLARLRVRGQLLELGSADLRFKPDEAAAFLAQWVDDVPGADVDRLETRTEGWAAGLQLAALALQAAQTPAERQAFVRAFAGSQRYVLDYLVEEVLQHQPADVQDFLLRTAILSRFSAEAAAALLDPPANTAAQAAALLDRIERASLFLIPLDAERRWFRYHALFAEALRSRLVQAGSVQLAELHRRAAEWFEGAGQPEPAIDHALSAGDPQRALRLLSSQARSMMIRGELTSLLTRADSLPRAVRDADPWLTAERAMALLFSGRVEDALALAAQGEAQLGGLEEDQARHIRGVLATLRAYAADLRGQPAEALREVERADAWLPPDDGLARSVLPYIRGRSFLATDDLAAAEEAFASMARLARSMGNVWTVAVAIGQQVFAARLRGRLSVAADVIAQAQRAVAERGEQTYGPAGLLDAAEAGVRYERGDLAGALTLLSSALTRLRAWGNPTGLTSALWSLARVQLALGDVADAGQSLDEADAIEARTPLSVYTRAALSAERARLWLAQGRHTDAARWAAACDLTAVAGPARDVMGLAVAQVRLALGRAVDAAELLADLAVSARSAGRNGPLLEILVQHAAALFIAGDRSEAFTTLEQALTLAEPEGYVRAFATPADTLRELLADWIEHRGRAVDDRRLVTFARGLAGVFAAPAQPGSAPTPAGGVAQPLIEPLSARELEVLRLVDAGLTNRQIAERLVVTVATAKKHIENLNGKLGVHSRTQALARARELGLI